MENLVLKQTMSSRDISDLTGRSHDNVLKSIRSMEGAWEKVCGVKFNVTYNEVSMPNGGNRKEPVYELTKDECLYIATKFNDEARARLIVRWKELETKEVAIANAKIKQMQVSAKRRNEIALRIHDIDDSIARMMSERKSLVKERNIIDNQDYAILSFPLFPEWDCLKAGNFPNKGDVLKVS